MHQVSTGAPEWRAYIEYASDVVLRGVGRVVVRTLSYLNTQLDVEAIQAQSKPPFIETTLDLVGKQVQFSPELGSNTTKTGLRDCVMSWLQAVANVGTLFPRIDGADGDYVREFQVIM